jgi:8-amino-7-oxononanoate synthase
LAERKAKGSLRSLSLFEGLIDFCSNDYLGMARDATVVLSLKGSTGSRLITGNSEEALRAEKQLAEFFGTEAALVFNSGYDANLGVFSSLPQKGDTILYDELIHASVRDGIRLSLARSYSFRHNDLEDLTAKYKHAEGTVFVAVESLYSMDGDIAPLSELSDWCARNEALLIVDEAHACGVFGDQGKGLCAEAGIEDRCFARVVTFGKAYGSHGAAVCGSELLREFLINFARSFIYTTALPPHYYTHLAHTVCVADKEFERQQLQQLIAFFRHRMGDFPSISDARSPIQVIPVQSLETCMQLAETLRKKGIAVKAILPPTVPEGGQRLRICLHAFNTVEELEILTEMLLSELD